MPIELYVDRSDYDKVTVGDVTDMQELVKDINYLEAEGFIEIEEDADGEPRLYPVT